MRRRMLEATDRQVMAQSSKIILKISILFRRGVAEAIYITKEKPDLNRDRGRHTLPVIYRELLANESHDRTSTSGSCDNNIAQCQS